MKTELCMHYASNKPCPFGMSAYSPVTDVTGHYS
jgi:hypothetical protein